MTMILGWVLRVGVTFSIIAVVAAQASQQCATKAYPPPASTKVPTYTVNLDLPPAQRWLEIAKDKKNEIVALLETVKNVTSYYFNGRVFELIDKYFPFLAYTFPYPFPEELQGISTVTGLSLGEVTFYNIFYEIFTVCTSIVAQDSNGQIYHGRNMDFGLLLQWDDKKKVWKGTEILRNLTMLINFQKGNSTIFQSVQFAGYVGVISAMKPKLFSLTVDERAELVGGYVGILEWILGFRKGHWMGFLSRNIMEVATSYEEAQTLLSKAELLSPVYFILGGVKPGQGSVITRGFKDEDVWNLGTQGSTWYLVETNYDHWEKTPFYDNRRAYAIKCMDKMNQKNATLGGLFNVLSTQPILNSLTVYSILMHTSAGHSEVYLQFCEHPCWPY